MKSGVKLGWVACNAVVKAAVASRTLEPELARYIGRDVQEQDPVASRRIRRPQAGEVYQILVPEAHPQLDRLGRWVSIQAADHLLDLHEVEAGGGGGCEAGEGSQDGKT